MKVKKKILSLQKQKYNNIMKKIVFLALFGLMSFLSYSQLDAFRTGVILGFSPNESILETAPLNAGIMAEFVLPVVGVGAEVDTASIPVSDEMKRKCAQMGWDALEIATSGGEDYELLFTISPENEKRVAVGHHIIGKIVTGSAIEWKGKEDKNYMGKE